MHYKRKEKEQNWRERKWGEIIKVRRRMREKELR